MTFKNQPTKTKTRLKNDDCPRLDLRQSGDGLPCHQSILNTRLTCRITYSYTQTNSIQKDPGKKRDMEILDTTFTDSRTISFL